MPLKEIRLVPIKESTEDYAEVERQLKELFRREIYYPLLRELGESSTFIKNARDRRALIRALETARVTFSRGEFSGRFSAEVSKELIALGAKFFKRKGVFKLSYVHLPPDVIHAVLSGNNDQKKKILDIDKTLYRIVPDEVAEKVNVQKAFKRTIDKVETKFQKSVRSITVAPVLSDAAKNKIAEEWQNNMKLWIKDFTEKEITELRVKVRAAAETGDRRESLLKVIQDSYGVSARKAKFLARQETSLLMTKFKETRYLEAGVKEYRWGCVAGSKLHPVRPAHRALGDASIKGAIFRWDDPPITSEPGEPVRRNNPGQDYNCRCFAIPVVRFRKD